MGSSEKENKEKEEDEMLKSTVVINPKPLVAPPPMTAVVTAAGAQTLTGSTSAQLLIDSKNLESEPIITTNGLPTSQQSDTRFPHSPNSASSDSGVESSPEPSTLSLPPVNNPNNLDSGINTKTVDDKFQDIVVPKPQDFVKQTRETANEVKELIEQHEQKQAEAANTFFTFEDGQTGLPYTTGPKENSLSGENFGKLTPSKSVDSALDTSKTTTTTPGSAFSPGALKTADSTEKIITGGKETGDGDEPGENMFPCVNKDSCNIGLAVFVRLMFMFHTFLTVYRVSYVHHNPLHWYLLFLLWPMFVEMVVAVITKKGKEYKWFSPSVLLYLIAIMPCIWILELNKIDRYIDKAKADSYDTFVRHCDTITTPGHHKDKGFVKLPGDYGPIHLGVRLTREGWVTVLEQCLVILLIIGRWLLPRGDLSRDQLSQLLLVYVGTAADIMELFEMFKEEEVRLNRRISIIILAIWTWSFLQFTFVITTFKSKKRKLGTIFFLSKVKKTKHEVFIDLCGIFSNLIFQDFPFLVLRLVLIFKYHILSVILIFFVMKNILVIFLEFYRVFVLYVSRKKKIAEIKHKVLIHSYFKTQPQTLSHMAVASAGEAAAEAEKEPKGVLDRARTSVTKLFGHPSKDQRYGDKGGPDLETGEHAPLIPISTATLSGNIDQRAQKSTPSSGTETATTPITPNTNTTSIDEGITSNQSALSLATAAAGPAVVTFKEALKEFEKVQKKAVDAEKAKDVAATIADVTGSPKRESIIDKVKNTIENVKGETEELLQEKGGKPGENLPIKKEIIHAFQMTEDVKELKEVQDLNQKIELEIKRQMEENKQKVVAEAERASITSGTTSPTTKT